VLLLDGAKASIPGEKPRRCPSPRHVGSPTVTRCWSGRGRRLPRRRALRRRPGARQDARDRGVRRGLPDGSRVAFVRKSDLWVVDVATGGRTRLTQGGSDNLLNGKLDWVYEEELASRSGQAFLWSPDSKKVAYLQLDQSRVPTFPIVDFVPCATRSSGSATRRRAPRTRSSAWASSASRRTARPAPSDSCLSPRTTSTSCPRSAGRRTRGTWPSST